jgi:hypothetical protein
LRLGGGIRGLANEGKHKAEHAMAQFKHGCSLPATMARAKAFPLGTATASVLPSNANATGEARNVGEARNCDNATGRTTFSSWGGAKSFSGRRVEFQRIVVAMQTARRLASSRTAATTFRFAVVATAEARASGGGGGGGCVGRLPLLPTDVWKYMASAFLLTAEVGPSAASLCCSTTIAPLKLLPLSMLYNPGWTPSLASQSSCVNSGSGVKLTQTLRVGC